MKRQGIKREVRLSESGKTAWYFSILLIIPEHPFIMLQLARLDLACPNPGKVAPSACSAGEESLGPEAASWGGAGIMFCRLAGELCCQPKTPLSVSL